MGETILMVTWVGPWGRGPPLGVTSPERLVRRVGATGRSPLKSIGNHGLEARATNAGVYIVAWASRP
jgi:hypothetical protein